MKNNEILYKIKVEEFIGIMLCAVNYEPNEWSSGPHDDYITIITLYDNMKEKDDEYENPKESIEW